MRYVYPCNIVRDVEEERATGREAYAVTFPDVYGANTGGWSWEEALEMAKDCLGVALGMYVKAHEDIPTPSQLAEGQAPVAVAPVVAAKLALYAAMREQGVANVALAARLGMQETAVRRLLDPGHRWSVEKVLEALGRSLVVEDRAAVQSPELSTALKSTAQSPRIPSGLSPRPPMLMMLKAARKGRRPARWLSGDRAQSPTSRGPGYGWMRPGSRLDGGRTGLLGGRLVGQTGSPMRAAVRRPT